MKDIIEKLHPLEVKVLNVISKCSTLEEVMDKANLKDVEVIRALQWLQNKDVLEVEKTEEEFVDLDVNGFSYKDNGLPEKRLLSELKKGDKAINEIKSLDKQEVGISIGSLKKKAAILMDKGKLSITPQGEKLLEKDSLEEVFLKKKFPISVSSLKDEEKFALDNLKSRKEIIKIEVKKTISFKLKGMGKELVKKKIVVEDAIDTLTPTMIKDGSWKDKKFRKYDVEAKVPELDGGKKHFVKEALEFAKQVWLDLGFKEMSGNMVQQSFWNFDALFTAQDHPVREMQDTFFIKSINCIFNKNLLLNKFLTHSF